VSTNPSKNDQAESSVYSDHPGMAVTTLRDRLRILIDVLIDSLERPARGDDLARRAYLSRFHFDRLVAAGLGEPPAGFRRRLLLERAAYELTRGALVLEASLSAGYSSGEAFARAFRRAFGVSPAASAAITAYRRRTAFTSTHPAACSSPPGAKGALPWT